MIAKNTITVYGLSITKDVYDIYKYSAIEAIEISFDTYSQLNWDKLNRLDIPQKRKILFLTKTREQMEMFSNGLNVGIKLEEYFEKMEKS